jgi:hypothetical protein
VDHYKARLVVRGSFQIHGVDFDKTYAPLAKFVLIKNLLAFVTTLHLEIHQMDVKNTFLNGEFQEKVYMMHQEGFEKKSSSIFLQIKQSNLWAKTSRIGLKRED